MRAVFLFSMLLLPKQAAFPQTNTVDSQNIWGQKSVRQMLVDDQQEVPASHPDGKSPITYEEFNRRSILRRQHVRELLAQGKIQSGEDFHDASVLFQHGETADDYLMGHILAMEAVIKGDDRSKWMVAATLDRYLQLIKRPQVFGTQYPRDPNAPAPQANEAGAAFKGRTLSPYDDQFLSDSLRQDFCVPNLEQQKNNVVSMNSGTYPRSTLIAPGCSR
jgi:hypothetical protein